MKLGVLISIGLFTSLTSCAPERYTYLTAEQGSLIVPRDEGEPQISRGEPIALLDGIGHYLISLPSKLVLWNWNVENHDISQQTEAALVEYLNQNNMSDVRVRLNEYSPIDEWSRLFNNVAVSAGWRYSFGFVSTLAYTLLPGRLLGGDHYNPFTNTINLYSDHIAIALHEAGHAKDFTKKDWRGTYAALGIIPGTSLFFEYEATVDALGYLEENNYCSEERDAFKVLYPAYATYIGGTLIDAIGPVNSILGLVAVIPAHIVGRVRASEIDPSLECCKCAAPENTTDGGT